MGDAMATPQFTWTIDGGTVTFTLGPVSAAPSYGDTNYFDTDYYKPAVARGADFLDRTITAPEWRPQIDLAELNLASPYRCVLGQLYGNYSDGLQRLGVSGRAVDLGFSTGAIGASCLCCISRGEMRAWEALTTAWLLELAPA
jgi:hypothetical protein